MKCEWLILCHDVQPHAGAGEFSIIGVFGRLTVDRLPGTVNPIAVAFRLSGTPKEEAQLQIAVIDPNGAPLKNTNPEQVTLSGYGFIDAHYPLGPVSLRMAGVHKIVLSINGRTAREIPFPVERLTLM